MTDRLSEIKLQMNTCLFHKCLCGGDTQWLIQRVEKLEKTLKEIASLQDNKSFSFTVQVCIENAIEALKEIK